MLAGRRKDNVATKRVKLCISHDVVGYERRLARLMEEMGPGERVYASAGQRDLHKAVREFRKRQIDAEIEEGPLQFYKDLEKRWTRCLMSESAQLEKFWLFDCDTTEESTRVRKEADSWKAAGHDPYAYPTKNGIHVIIKPFDLRRSISQASMKLIHKNPLMLVAYAADS